jgi:molybdate transport system regulatory protein
MKAEVRFQIRDKRRTTPLAIGPGKVALLEAIARTGSITAAARTLGMSYRRAWLLVDETNRCLLRPAVQAAAGGRHGGGTVLTPTGVELVRRYRALERETEMAVARQLRPMLRSLPAGNGNSAEGHSR